MKLIKEGNIYICECTYPEKDIAKLAGFWWHSKYCSKNKCELCSQNLLNKWWTKIQDNAIKLYENNPEIEIEPELKSEFLSIIQKKENNRKASRASNADIDIPKPKKLEYLPFQKAGIAFCSNKNNVLLADEMGCISGDTLITVNRACKGFQIKLKDAYLRFNNLTKKNHNWNNNIKTYTRSLSIDHKQFRLNEIISIIDSGIKDTYEIITETHTLKTTIDHEFLTSTGEIPLEKLNVGDFVFINGISQCPLCGSTENLITYEYAEFHGYCKECMYKNLRKNGNPNNKSLSKDGYIMITNGLSYHPFGVVGDPKVTLFEFIRKLTKYGITSFENEQEILKKRRENIEELRENHEKYRASDSALWMDKEPIKPQRVLKAISDNFTKDDYLVTDASASARWIGAYFPVKGLGRKIITPRGVGPTGFGVGALIGTCIAADLFNSVGKKSRKVLLTGDGGLMNGGINEFETIKKLDLDCTIIVLNNSAHGFVKFGQAMLYAKRYYDTDRPQTNFAKLAEAFGGRGFRVEKLSQLDSTIQQAMKSEGFNLIDVVIDPLELLPPNFY